jgi:acyl-CoA thioesterase-1
MTVSDIDGTRFDCMQRKARRAFIAHCSAAALALAAAWPASAQAQGSRQTVLVVGDSLSAEYGLARGSGWVALLQQRVDTLKLPCTVINASISGDTTAGGRARLAALLKQHNPKVVVIELGGNDALRGLPLEMTQTNLTAMAKAAKDAGARVLIIGMAVPPNYGRKYSEDFVALFRTVATAEHTALVPFLMAGLAEGDNAEQWFQPDRIHLKAEAHPHVLDNVWPTLRPLLLR